VSTTDVVAPATADELVAALAQATPRTRLLAGGTDLVNDIRRPGRRPDLLIDLSHVAGLSYVRLDGGTLRVGAATTFTELQSDPLVHEYAFCLERAASQVGSAQIRNVATIGGNIANASPCADGATALVALSAEVTTLDGSGRRVTRRLRDLLVGSGRTTLAHDEVIMEFSFAALGDEHRSAFAKIGWRTAVSVARLSMALVVRFDPVAEALSEVRVGLGAVGETAFRDAILEGLLEGRPADEETARVLADGSADAVRRSIPGRYSLPYKERAAVGLAYDAWNALRICPPCEPAWG
jgi:CO/xanthine dehydrogenase FAD-binding subunit